MHENYWMKLSNSFKFNGGLTGSIRCYAKSYHTVTIADALEVLTTQISITKIVINLSFLSFTATNLSACFGHIPIPCTKTTQ